MGKLKILFKNNIKIIVAFILGVIISGTSVYAAILYASSDVSYDNTTSGLTSTNVQDALDELYVKTNTWIDPSDIDFTTVATNTSKTILASNTGICIKRNNEVSCFKINNWDVECNHIRQVFSDISCFLHPSVVGCAASDFNCNVGSNGSVSCVDSSDGSRCSVNPTASVSCT